MPETIGCITEITRTVLHAILAQELIQFLADISPVLFLDLLYLHVDIIE